MYSRYQDFKAHIASFLSLLGAPLKSVSYSGNLPRYKRFFFFGSRFLLKEARLTAFLWLTCTKDAETLTHLESRAWLLSPHSRKTCSAEGCHVLSMAGTHCLNLCVYFVYSFLTVQLHFETWNIPPDSPLIEIYRCAEEHRIMTDLFLYTFGESSNNQTRFFMRTLLQKMLCSGF